MGQTTTCRGVATTIRTDDHGVTHVCYHQTDVVSFDARRVTLRTGGWYTVTTKTRMNQASHQFNLGFSVYQDRGQWFVRSHHNGHVQRFVDGMTIRRVRIMWDGERHARADKRECKAPDCEYRSRFCHARGVTGCSVGA